MAPDSPPIQENAEDTALRADVYRLLGRLLLASPDRELLDFLASLEVEEDDSPLAAAWHGLADAAGTTTPQRAEREHFQALVGVIQGEVTPYASWYLNGTLMDEPLVALRRDLRRLGIGRREDNRDPEDHLGALCETMALLVEGRSPDQAAFFERHLAGWAEHCMDDLAGVEAPFYAATGRLGAGYLALERARLEVTHCPDRPQRIPVDVIDAGRPAANPE